MGDISGKIEFGQFVDDMLLKLKLTDDEYNRLVRIAADGMLQMELNYLSNVKDAKLTIDTDTNTVAFPSDLVNFISISIPYNGRMWTFTREDSLVITTDGTEDVNETYDVNDGEGVNIADNGVVESIGSRGGVNKYYYTVDRRRGDNGRIAFSGFTPDHVILRYVSTNVDDTATNYIPKVAVRALEYFVRWMNADYLDAPYNKTRDLERKYKDEVRLMKKNLGYSIAEIRDVIRQTASQSVRR